MKKHKISLDYHQLALTDVKYFPRHNNLSLFMKNNVQLSDIEKRIQFSHLDRPRFVAETCVMFHNMTDIFSCIFLVILCHLHYFNRPSYFESNI